MLFQINFLTNLIRKTKTLRNFREFEVWQDGRKFVNLIYDETSSFPLDERFGLTSQLNRAAVSIILNIAEGASRRTDKDFARFLEISIGSAFEVETILLISSDRGMIPEKQAEDLIKQLHSIQKRLNSFISRLSQ